MWPSGTASMRNPSILTTRTVSLPNTAPSTASVRDAVRACTDSEFRGDVFALTICHDGTLQTCRIILNRYRYIGDNRARRVGNDTPNRS